MLREIAHLGLMIILKSEIPPKSTRSMKTRSRVPLETPIGNHDVGAGQWLVWERIS